MLPPLEIEMRTSGCRVGAPLKRRCQKPHGHALAGAFVLRHTWAATPVAKPLPARRMPTIYADTAADSHALVEVASLR